MIDWLQRYQQQRYRRGPVVMEVAVMELVGESSGFVRTVE
eukprot:CAMPEP_0119540106 /NCGR_PEP_ID=MMETSP1344-20130328/52089_1 /TAXON_ID=236787 /ORGANISM="Florenciella parvula, Strain CCMP2471" /LENGTH=39 /DNA_ID= /DNA_START= /DNA_END= /DNA_ORIENTATION=